MIPRQLFYSVLSPISWSLVIVPFFHSGHHFSNFYRVLDISSYWCLLGSTCTNFYTFSFVSTSLFYLNFLRPCTFLIALNLSLIMTSINMWLLFISAYLYVRASIADLFYLLLSMMWSIWLFVLLSCEYICKYICGCSCVRANIV